MKVLVCGSRGWDRPDLVGARLARLPAGTVVVHGACPEGADLHCALHCVALGIEQRPYPANWKRYGRSAGHKRNAQMLDENPDVELVLAFWDGTSSGTRGMLDLAKRRSVPVEVVMRPARAPSARS